MIERSDEKGQRNVREKRKRNKCMKEQIKETKKGFKEQERKEDVLTDKSKGRERNMKT